MKALVTWGGWDGHEPDLVAKQFSEMLISNGFDVDIFDTLDCFDDPDELDKYDLIVPVWTMSELTKEKSQECVLCGISWYRSCRLSRWYV